MTEKLFHFNIIGAGEWGLSFANHLFCTANSSEHGSTINVYIRNDDNLHLAKTKYFDSALNFYNINQLNANHINQYTDVNRHTNIIACSSAGFANIINDHKSYFEKFNHLCWLTKGLDHDSGLLFHDVIDAKLNSKMDKCIISGPSFARDLDHKRSIEVSFASTSEILSRTLNLRMSNYYFKLIPTTNIIGVEIAGIIKNISAILAGILTANNYQQKDIDRLIILSQHDIQKMSNKVLKNNPNYSATKKDISNIITSPACLGDLRLTCLQDVSRNRQFGLKIVSGVDVNKLLSDIGTVEGYLSTSTLKNNQTYFGFSNIVDSAYKILYLKNEPNVVIKNLLA